METVIVQTKDPVLFQELSKANESELHLMGGKAATLARLLQKGFPVPEGAVVFQEPQSPAAFQKITAWWEARGGFPVAVRSSASGEDSSDFSYAGQFLTLLHIDNKSDLVAAIKTCFEAVTRKSSQAYAAHFDRTEIPMHLLIQRMVQSKFSGVYFSVDPRTADSEWLVEVVPGQGEQLVSGQVNPFRFKSGVAFGADASPVHPDWKPEYLQQVLHWGQEVEKAFGYKVDMEWAIDQDDCFWVLQSRPITTQGEQTSRQITIDQEWERILSQYSQDSMWDGHTFAEWTGVPTDLTFDLWQRTFQKNQAFDLSLKAIGYEGFHDKTSQHSLLDRIFGKAYINLKAMEPIYFGEAPYHLEPHPRPHLELDWKKMSPAMLLRAPLGILRMGRVAWNIQTGREELCKKALNIVREASDSSSPGIVDLRGYYQEMTVDQLKQELKLKVDLFSQRSMQGPFLMTLLIESTTQGLLALIEKDLGIEKATEVLTHLSGAGLQTVATEMSHELSSIGDSSEKWEAFKMRYGHRGVGELELSHPRWLETEKPHFKSLKKPLHENTPSHDTLVTEILSQLSSIRRPVFKQEWAELQKLMQVREEIKMEVMKPFSYIRWLVLAIAEKFAFGADIFWLTFDEIAGLDLQGNTKDLQKAMQQRKQRAHHFKAVDLPMIFTLQELRGEMAATTLDVNSQTPSAAELTTNAAIVKGVSLSPGIASGVVHIVDDPEQEDLDMWPENYVLVAEATDPGWTPLFERAQAVIVARGGVLSHCAIVAREMNLPAVGEVRGVSHLFKEGERVWVNGNNGTIRRGH